MVITVEQAKLQGVTAEQVRAAIRWNEETAEATKDPESVKRLKQQANELKKTLKGLENV
jgi:DNA-binding transcriptional MerR regulator